MPNSSPIDRREEVEQCDRIAAAAITATSELRELILAGRADGGDYVQAFKVHRLAERERCAGIAEEYAAKNDKPFIFLIAQSRTQQVRYEGHKYAGQNIATAIRSPNPWEPARSLLP